MKILSGFDDLERLALIDGKLVSYELGIHPPQLAQVDELLKNRPYLGMGRIHSVDGIPVQFYDNEIIFFGPDTTLTPTESQIAANEILVKLMY